MNKQELHEKVLLRMIELTGIDFTTSERSSATVNLRAIFYKLANDLTFLDDSVIAGMVGRTRTQVLKSKQTITPHIFKTRPDLVDLYNLVLNEFDSVGLLRNKLAIADSKILKYEDFLDSIEVEIDTNDFSFITFRQNLSQLMKDLKH